MVKFREREFIDTMRPIPFNNSFIIKYSKHNKVINNILKYKIIWIFKQD
jgi:hypothetical protein